MSDRGVQGERQIDGSLTRKLFYKKTKYDRIFIVISAFFFYCGYYFAKTVLPLHIKTLNGSDAIVGRTMAIISGAALATRWVAGTLQDKYGSKPFIVGAALCLAFVSLSYNFVESIQLLTVAAFFQGVAIGSFATIAMAQIVDGVESEIERTSALSFFSMSHLTAGSVAPWMALAMATTMGTGNILGWSAIWGLAAALPAFYLSPMPPKEYKDSTDISLGVSILGDKILVGACFCYFVWAISQGIIYSFLPLFSQARGITNAGVFFTSFALTNLIGRAFVKKLAVSIGSIRLVNISSFFIIISMCILSVAQNTYYLAVAGVIYGLGSTAIYPCLAGIATGRDQENMGLTIALFMSNLELGQMVGAFVLGNVASRRGYPVI
ncbi:MAG: MFS transporter, partial [Clostridiaceae bacterium]|nr:MFS transporter [Clostridiaceae bacterium]